MRLTPYYRVSGCRNATGGITSVCVRQHDRLQGLLRFAYDDRRTVNRAVRSASRDLAATAARSTEAQAAAGGSWSQAVVARAFSKLTGSYDPVKAERIKAERDSFAQLAAENNRAWEQVA